MVYTSGTTGKPKGVKRPLTGQSPDDVPVASSAFFSIFGLAPFDDHVHICGSPLYHTAVLNFVGISIQLGHTAVLMERFDAEEMLRLIERHHVTHSHMVPTQFTRLLALPEDVRAKYDVTSLRAMIHGAAPCPDEVKRAMLEWWGPVVIEYYAATEGGGASISATEWLSKPGSVGKAWPYSVIKILDDNGDEVATGETGLVYMRMGQSSFDYHKSEEKTRESRVGDLFTVGDIGYLDEDGYLFLCDRKSDMIISGGVNIYPAEIEGELVMHPAVADVAVFGVPDDQWGEAIKAVIQPAEGVEPTEQLTADINAFAAARLAKYKLPKIVEYIDELPRDDNGKLYKRKLRDPSWAGRSASDLDGQDELAGDVTGHEFAVRVGGVAQRIGAVDDHAQAPRSATLRRASPRAARRMSSPGSAPGPPPMRWMPSSPRPKAAIETMRLCSGTSSSEVSIASSVPIRSVAASMPSGASARTRSASPGP